MFKNTIEGIRMDYHLMILWFITKWESFRQRLREKI